jgi:hypothetical protein
MNKGMAALFFMTKHRNKAGRTSLAPKQAQLWILALIV